MKTDHLATLKIVPPSDGNFKSSLADATMEELCTALDHSASVKHKTRYGALRSEIHRRYRESGQDTNIPPFDEALSKLEEPALTETPSLSAEHIGSRLERIRGWHRVASGQAWKLKLLVFFAGMEMQALKADLGVSQGGDRANGNGFRLLGKTFATWEELVSSECGITDRTARNYVTAYQNMADAAPEVLEKILKAAAPILEGKDVLALPNPEEVIAAVPEKALQDFREAVDPWSLSELYQKALKPAQAQHIEETTKAESKKQEQQQMLKFWFEEFDSKLRTKSHLRLPKPQRELLLNTLEITITELRDSLRTR